MGGILPVSVMEDILLLRMKEHWSTADGTGRIFLENICD